jgi:hypothetical protein
MLLLFTFHDGQAAKPNTAQTTPQMEVFFSPHGG